MVSLVDPDSATAAPFKVTDVAFAVVQLTFAVFVPLSVPVRVTVGGGAVPSAIVASFEAGPSCADELYARTTK
jgi:hypothetical protein